MICLIRPPSVVPVGAYIGSLTPPIGLAYLAGSLLKAGHEVTVIDAVGEALDDCAPCGDNLIQYGLSFESILKRIPDQTIMIGMSGMFSSEWNALRPLYEMITEKFSKECLVVAGGEHFTAAPEICMNSLPHLDAIVFGEGEETIVELAEKVQSGLGIKDVRGLMIRSGEGLQKTDPRSRVRSIDEIPWPAWDLIPLEEYFSRGLSYGVNRGRSMPMLASRGCPFQCTFCSNPLMWGTRWLARDVSDLVDEIEYYIKKYSITNVDFYDLTAIVKKDWIKRFCRELIARNINLTWQLPSGTRSEAIDYEVSLLLYQSGCRNMNYAPESGSTEILRQVKKKVKLENMYQSLRSANRAGINVKLNIIIGLPMERHVDIWKTFWSLLRFSYYGAYDVSIGIFAPYPGSELYSELVENGRISHSETYWEKLSYVDITKAESYNPKMSANVLLFYNWLGIVMFYASNYAFRPIRFARTINNLVKGHHESRGEMALQGIFNRLKIRFMS